MSNSVKSVRMNYQSILFFINLIFKFRKEYEKHLALIRKRLNLLKKEGNHQVEKVNEILNWLSSDSAKSFYPSTLLPDQFSIWQEQFDSLSQLETAKISKEIESGRLRLAASEPLDKLIDRSEVQNFSFELTEILRKLSKAAPQKYLETFAHRLLRIVLSNFCGDEGLRVALADELKSICENANDSCFPTIEFINFNINSECKDLKYNSSANESFPFTSPKIIFKTIQIQQATQDETILKLFDDFEASINCWQRGFPFVSFASLKKEVMKYKLKSLITLNYHEDALQLSNQFNDQDLLDDFIFEPVLKILESLNKTCRAILLIEQKLMIVDPEHPCLILRLADNLIVAQRYSEAAEYLKAIPEAYPSLDSETEAHLFFSTGINSWHTSVIRTKATLSHFLSAAKANPSKSIYFHWIAKFYWRIERDEARARKCLLKALSLDPLNLEAALLFSEISFETFNNTIDIVTLLQPFTKISSQSRYRRLFYYYGIALFYNSRLIEASVAFQSALKGNNLLYNEDNTDPVISDEICLHWIGESFLRSNRLGSAFKAFTRLSSSSASSSSEATIAVAQILSKVGLASVHLASNNPIGAVDCLELNDLKSDAKPEINSLMLEKVQLDKAEAFLALARHYFQQGRFISAMKATLNSLKLTTNLQTAESFRISSIALGLANCYQEICEFPRDELKQICEDSNFQNLEVNSGLVEIENLIKKESKEKFYLLIASVKFALAALSSAFKDPSKHFLATYWLQLAVALSIFENCFEFSHSAASMAIETSSDNCKEIISQANHLKFILYSKNIKTFRQAQHHIILAIKANETASLWIDLGRFYRQAGDWELASEALKQALAVDQENLVAAFELAQGAGTIEGNEGALQVSQRAFSTQPVHFTESFAWTLLNAKNNKEKEKDAEFNSLSNFALVYLKKRYANDSKVNEILANKQKGIDKSQIATNYNSTMSPLDRLKFLNSSDENWNLWLSPENLALDCEFLLKRPENEFTQSGWRAVVEGLLPEHQERTIKELEDLNK